MESPELFASLLQRLMDERGLTQQALSKSTGTPQSTISRWLGGAKPDLDGVCKLARYFGCSVDYLCGMSARPSELRPGNWIIDSDLIARFRRGEKIDRRQHWAVAIPDRYRIVTSAEYQAIRTDLGLD